METRCSSADLGATPEVRYQVPRYSGWKQLSKSSSSISSGGSDTKYRDIADGNIHLPLYSPQVFQPSDTKYRDIADGNSMPQVFHHQKFPVRYQVPRYSGWKLLRAKRFLGHRCRVRYQVPRYSGWKRRRPRAHPTPQKRQIPSTAI